MARNTLARTSLSTRTPTRPMTSNANEIQEAVGDIEQRHQYGQTNERRDAIGGQHPIIDLQHVEGAGQRQQIDHAGEQSNRNEKVF